MHLTTLLLAGASLALAHKRPETPKKHHRTKTTPTTTTPAAAAPPTPSPSSCGTPPGSIQPIPGSSNYIHYFTGYGLTLSASNPSNTNPQTTAFADPNSTAAILACGNFAANQVPAYYSFDLHYRIADEEWVCVAYLDFEERGAQAWSVRDQGVGCGFGYSVQ